MQVRNFSTTISSDPGWFLISFEMKDWKYFVPFYCTICTYILTNFLPVRLNCLKIRTDQLQFSMNSALTIRMLLLLKSIWCISSIFCSVYLNYIEIFSLYKHFKKLLLSGWSCRRSYGWHHGYWWTQVKYSNWKIISFYPLPAEFHFKKNNFPFSFIWPYICYQNLVKTTREKYKEEWPKMVNCCPIFPVF